MKPGTAAILRLAACLAAALLPLRSGSAADLPSALMRFPSASAESIVFVAYGSLWIVPRVGGRATKLTDDPGQVFMPRFSPDGRSIAFTWRRQGGEDVYVVPAAGGTPRRLTHGPSANAYDNMVTGWTPDGANILFLSSRRARFQGRDVAAYSVPLQGGLASMLPMENAGLLSMSPDGKAVAFDRTFRNFGGDRWKRYIGGEAPEIYLYDFATAKQTRFTDWNGSDTAPMWVGRRLYFLSDRDGARRLNLWVTDLDTHATREVTHFTDLDLDVPALGPGAITFQQGGLLWLLDLPSERLHAVRIDLPADARVAQRAIAAAPFVRREDVAHQPDQAMSQDGKTVILDAHGDLFAVRADGSAKNVTATPGVDEDHPAVSPDGRTLAFITDASGEQQVATMALDGGPARTITTFGHGVLYTPRWSPDGRLLAVADGEHGLWLVHADGTGAARIALDPNDEIHDAQFSPDSRRLAYSTLCPTLRHIIHLRDIQAGTDIIVTPPMESDREPAFSQDGATLFFISARHELPVVSDRAGEIDIASVNSDGIYAASLAAEASAGTGEPTGLTQRARALPVQAGALSALAVRGSRIFYRAAPIATIGDDLPGTVAALHVVDTKSGTDRIVAERDDGQVISADGGTALVRRGAEWHLVSTGAASDTKLDLSRMRVTVDPRAEWREMFGQAWRLDRDIFWNPRMNGVDWPAARAAYANLASLAGSHEDAIFVIGELQGELSNSHMFIIGSRAGGDGDDRPKMPTALLGADFVLDAASGRYGLGRIYRGDSARERFRAPLGDPGLTVHEGDYLLAIDGEELRAPDDPYRLLIGKSGPLALSLSGTAGGERRVVTVRPITSEYAIRQSAWIEQNRETVGRLSGGRVGYLFLSDFDELGSEDFLQQYYPQTDRQGLVIDERWNGGGFTSQWVLSILRRPLAGGFVNREGGVTPLPGAVPPRALAVVMNAFSASDGDQFPYYFHTWGLGTVVGERSWGGVRGIKGPWQLIDGTGITIPKDSLFAPDGRWVIENHGADPDITVANEPALLAAGHDSQLEAATSQVLESLQRHPAETLRVPPLNPAYPADGTVPAASFGQPQQTPLQGRR